MANGMGSLYIGVSGLHSAQTALNTTAHNLANINTEGYTRQQITFEDMTYLTVGTRSNTIDKYGLGVSVSEIRRIRDTFIDRAYRTENGRLGYYESNLKAVEEVEDLFGEMQGVTYQDCLKNLYSAVNELSKNPESTVARSSLIQYTSAFVNRSNKIYESLKDYQTTLNTEVQNSVNRINELGQTIFALNKQIQGIESGSGEYANDLRDQRDNALDELSGYIKMSYYEEANGRVIVTCEGIPFVNENNVTEMSTRTMDSNSLLIPTWPSFEKDVFDITQPISNGSKNDMGSLKGAIIARGSVNVKASDVPVKPDESDYDLTTAEGQAAYDAANAAYQEKQDYYNTYIEPSAILSAMAGLDKLVNGIVESINDVLCPEKEITLDAPLTDSEGNEIAAAKYTYKASSNAVLYTRHGQAVQGTDNGDGTYSYEASEKLYVDANQEETENIDSMTYNILDMSKSGYGMDDDETRGVELFKRNGTDRYKQITGADGSTIYVRNNLNVTGFETDYTLGNLIVNPEASQNVGTLPLSTEHGKEDFSKVNELIDTFSKKFASLNPENYAKADFNTFYNDYIGEFATMGSVLTKYVNNQTTMVNGYDNQRLQTSGVSSDEELQKMIKYQHAYNAASRYINVVSEMIEHLVTSLGHA